MKNLLASALCVFTCIGANCGQAQSLDGYCLDLVYSGCMPRFIPFEDMSIGFCEETCSIVDPIRVRGIDAVLFEMSCIADYDTPLNGQRVMILRQQTENDRYEMSWIDKENMFEIVPCP